MSRRLVEEGWVHPPDPGPGRRAAVVILLGGALLLLGWGVVATGWLEERLAPEVRDVVLTVARDGAVQVDGRPAPTQLRERAGVAFVVASAPIRGDGSDPVRVRARVADGIDVDQVVVRELLPVGTAKGGRLLVTVRADVLPSPPQLPADVDSLPSLRAQTDPFDARVREVREDSRLLTWLRDGWWWISPLALLLAGGVPLLGWHRMRRRTFDQRVPGAGRDVELAPPSSTDPVGAAILVAGAGPADPADAFAGHLLDLVERRQLPMRRSAATPAGPGTLVGLHHAAEVDDLAVELLAELVDVGQGSLFLSDDVRAVPALSRQSRARWIEHLDARAGFERLVERPEVARLRLAAAGLLLTSFLALVLAPVSDLQGRSALALLVAATAATAGAATGAWSIDASRWRTVARGRRTERAQWIAWREARSADRGGLLDDRSLPVLVATGADLRGVRASAPPDAVDLAAVTARTVASLRAIVDPPS